MSGRDLPDPHARTPGKQPSLWLLSQLLWHREGRPVKSGRGGILQHRWLFQSTDEARLGPSCWQQTSTLICMLPAEVLVARAGLRLPLVLQWQSILCSIILQYLRRDTVVWSTSVLCSWTASCCCSHLCCGVVGGLQLELSHTLNEARLHTQKGKSWERIHPESKGT